MCNTPLAEPLLAAITSSSAISTVGLASLPSGPVVGYVLDSELEVQVDNGPVRVYKRVQVWFEPSRAVHRVSRNPSKTKPARFLAFMLMTRDDKHLVLPEKP
jgi:quercetin dioxygenase-like cupin family protein